jgi:2'-5' RNA ligase
MRLFIAFEVPEHVSSELRRIQEQIRQEGIKLVRQFHLTFKFLGEVDDNKINEIKSDLQKISMAPFEASLNGIGVFPNMRHINTIWIGLEPENRIEELAKKIDPEQTRFKAHVTIGRVKFIKSKEKLIENINKVKVPKLTFRIDNIKLIKSTLTKEGPVYEILFEKPL